jgi:hypothetical protein
MSFRSDMHLLERGSPGCTNLHTKFYDKISQLEADLAW